MRESSFYDKSSRVTNSLMKADDVVKFMANPPAGTEITDKIPHQPTHNRPMLVREGPRPTGVKRVCQYQ